MCVLRHFKSYSDWLVRGCGSQQQSHSENLVIDARHLSCQSCSSAVGGRVSHRFYHIYLIILKQPTIPRCEEAFGGRRQTERSQQQLQLSQRCCVKCLFDRADLNIRCSRGAAVGPEASSPQQHANSLGNPVYTQPVMIITFFTKLNK